MPLPSFAPPAIRRLAPTLRPPRLPACPAKRVVDLLGAVPLAALAALPLLVIAALLCAGQGGRAFVREPAAGLGGRPFRTWRLRTDAGRGGWGRRWSAAPWTRCRSCSTCSEGRCHWSGRARGRVRTARTGSS
ncbi:hypothetical protein ACFQFR_19550 [Streptomyces goshikiensis]